MFLLMTSLTHVTGLWGPHLAFNMGSGDLNTGLHSFIAKLLPTKPHLKHCLFILYF